MLVLYDLPHQRKANSFRNFHQKNVTYAESLRNLHIQIPRSWDALSLCLQGKNQSLTFRIELLLCYPLATLLSHPQLFHTKDLAKWFNIWNMWRTYQIPTVTKCKLWLLWLSHSKVRHFLLCRLELLANYKFQHFSPCYKDLTNFENQMVFLPFKTDNQLFYEFNFSRENWILIRITIWVLFVLEGKCQKHLELVWFFS